MMPLRHGVTQRSKALIEIAKGVANQWFGYVIYPNNWQFAWVNIGLSTRTAYEMARLVSKSCFNIICKTYLVIIQIINTL